MCFKKCKSKAQSKIIPNALWYAQRDPTYPYDYYKWSDFGAADV